MHPFIMFTVDIFSFYPVGLSMLKDCFGSSYHQTYSYTKKSRSHFPPMPALPFLLVVLDGVFLVLAAYFTAVLYGGSTIAWFHLGCPHWDLFLFLHCGRYFRLFSHIHLKGMFRLVLNTIIALWFWNRTNISEKEIFPQRLLHMFMKYCFIWFSKQWYWSYDEREFYLNICEISCTSL